MIRLFIIAQLVLTGLFSTALSQDIQIVNNDGQPIAGASVMIGASIDNPFKDNVVTTDLNGFLPELPQWRSSLSITIDAPNYVRTTFYDITPDANILKVQKADGQTMMEVRGVTKEFGRLRRDGKVDISMIFPGMAREDLLSFDISSVLSPEFDRLKILTKTIDIPSNTSIPKQKESYILPITLNKPVYRVYFRQPGDYRLTATHARFPLKKVVDKIRAGKSFFDILEFVDFVGAGQLDVNVSGNLKDKDIAVNQMKFRKSFQISAPNYDNSKYSMLSVSLVNQAGLLFPTDVKKIAPNGKAKLKTPSLGQDNFVLSLLSPPVVMTSASQEIETIIEGSPNDSENLFPLTGIEIEVDSAIDSMSSDQHGLSFALQPADTTEAPKFLEVVQAPEFVNNELILNTPAMIEGVHPLATFIVLAEIDEKQGSQFNSSIRTRIWELNQFGWADRIAIPELAVTMNPDRKYRWEVFFLGTTHENIDPSNYLEAVTHLSRAYVEL